MCNCLKIFSTKERSLTLRTSMSIAFSGVLWLHYTNLTGHPERTTSYPHFSSVLNYEGIKFPVALRDIPKFEKLNNLSINVYGIKSEFTQKNSEKSKIISVYLSNHFYSKKIIHLLIIEKNMNIHDNDMKNYEPRFHFALIKNLSRLVKSQLSKGHSKLFFCDRCLNHYKKKNRFINTNLIVCMELPNKENKILKFTKFQYKDTVPFIVYADLECMLEPQGDDENNTQKHVPHSIAFYCHCTYNDKLSKFEINRSPSCIEWFVKKLQFLASEFDHYLRNPIPMKQLTKE
ncbi:GSCOCG00012641001-RA-CDS, partial [Cotesia congregata]